MGGGIGESQPRPGTPGRLTQPMLATPKNLVRWLLPVALLLGWMWWRVVQHLHVIWTVDEQYRYGWAVPLLCALLGWRRWSALQSSTPVMMRPPERLDDGRLPSPSAWPQIRALTVILILAFLGTRLIEEANPDWRFVGWALALEVIGVSLLLLRVVAGPVALRQYAFPVAFFLVAVPWPTVVEHPLVQTLTRGLVALTVELLQAFGYAAIPRGNVIETAGGLVDVDEACSGIRSLQAALMLALFFGEWRRLTVRRRLLLAGGALALACVFNLGRTLLLSLIAAEQGTAASTRWHDPASVVILVGCFLGVWVGANWLARSQPPALNPKSPSAPPVFRGLRVPWSVGFAVLVLVGELAIHFWYAGAAMAPAVDWRAEFPRNNPTFKPVALPPVAREILRFNEGESGTWEPGDGTRWQMIYLRWEPGRVAATLARNHTPEICLPAAGRNVREVWDLAAVQAGGLSLPFRGYAVEHGGRPLFVFYSLWEDGALTQRVGPQLLTWRARFEAVRDRRRNRGQRVVQVGLWGARDAEHAEALLREQLPALLRSPSDR